MNTGKHRLFNFKSAFARVFSRFVILFCLFAGSSFGQKSGSAPKQIDWVDQSAALEKALRSGDTEQKRDALVQIRSLKTPEASRIAVLALKDKSEIVRATAASSIVFLPPDDAARAILPLLNDKNEFVRKEAAFALGKTRSPIAAAPLVAAQQKDKKPEVKSAAIIALGEIGDPSVIPFLTRVLQTNRRPPDEFLRRAAARSIGQIAQTIQTGIVKVVTPESFVSEANRIAPNPKYPRLIENFPVFAAANQILIETLQNSREAGDVRREAAFALGAVGDESALPALRANLNAEDNYLAQICREAVEKILNNQAIIKSAR